MSRLVNEGKSVEETMKLVDLTKYQSWAGYQDMRDLNIAGMYRLVQARR